MDICCTLILTIVAPRPAHMQCIHEMFRQDNELRPTGTRVHSVHTVT